MTFNRTRLFTVLGRLFITSDLDVVSTFFNMLDYFDWTIFTLTNMKTGLFAFYIVKTVQVAIYIMLLKAHIEYRIDT